MILYALVASDTDFAVDLYVTREAAADALADVLSDEPAFADLLSNIRIDPADSSSDSSATN